MQNKIRKNINPKNILRNEKQEFPCQSLESFSEEHYNMENKILNFQFGPICTNQTRHPQHIIFIVFLVLLLPFQVVVFGTLKE